ncbi:MAG: hypothetical protein QNJ54_30630 [Prochloraceae cyanobacterium]|nr:hypothetical protein [Prochloraceae cyanobacterium]
MPLSVLSQVRMSTPNPSSQGFGNLETILKLLNLFELKKELDQPICAITSLSELQRQTELILETLERAFEMASESCSHWTINGLFGSGVIASSLEKLVHLTHQKLTPSYLSETSDNWQIRQISHTLVAEIAVNMSLNCLGLLASINPILTSLGIISTAVVETLVQYTLNLLAVESFSIFTVLIRQRLTEYPEFRNFLAEYRLYTNFFQAHQYQQVYNLQIQGDRDIFNVFKLIDTFSGVTNRRDLLHKLIRILEKDEIFQDRLKQKFAQLGGIFLKLSEML